MSDIALLLSKITIFIIEITLKQLLLTKYGWNNPNWGRLGLKSQKTSLFGLLAAQNSSHIQTFKYMSRAQFLSELDFFFEILVTMSSITINNHWNYQKLLIKSQWSLKYYTLWLINICNQTFWDRSTKKLLKRGLISLPIYESGVVTNSRLKYYVSQVREWQRNA